MTIVIKDGERLYLSPWDFNACLIVEQLEKIIKDNGGKVKKAHWIMGSNRAIDGEPRKMRGQKYITFTLDDKYYYFQIDDNPFFPHYYQKTAIVDGKRLRNVYLEEFSREWIYDCLLGVANDAEIKEIAYQVFNLLVQAKNSSIYQESHKIRVGNLYDGGWHWENQVKPSEWVKVDIEEGA